MRSRTRRWRPGRGRGLRNPAELVILDGFAEPLRNAGVRVVDRPFRDRTAEPDRALTEHRGE